MSQKSRKQHKNALPDAGTSKKSQRKLLIQETNATAQEQMNRSTIIEKEGFSFFKPNTAPEKRELTAWEKENFHSFKQMIIYSTNYLKMLNIWRDLRCDLKEEMAEERGDHALQNIDIYKSFLTILLGIKLGDVVAVQKRKNMLSGWPALFFAAFFKKEKTVNIFTEIERYRIFIDERVYDPTLTFPTSFPATATLHDMIADTWLVEMIEPILQEFENHKEKFMRFLRKSPVRTDDIAYQLRKVKDNPSDFRKLLLCYVDCAIRAEQRHSWGFQ